jgi:hypothetical protein
MPKGREDVLCTGPAIRPQTVRIDAQFWAANEAEIEERFEQWLTS